MKKIFYSIFAAVAMFTACNEEVITDGTGSLNLKIGEVSDKYMTKADAIDKDEFYVTLTDWNGNVVESDGVTYRNILYKNLPDEISGLPSGPYTISVSSHEDIPAASFDNPVYGGSTTFTVKTGATTPVTVRCTVQNVKVTINPSAGFLSELTSYTITVTNEDGGSVHWTNDAAVTGSNVTTDLTLPAHFSVSALDVNVTGYRKINGAELNLQENAEWNGKIAEVAAADHHIINIDARTTGAAGGENGITITVDGSQLNEVESNLDVPGFEDIPVDGPDRGENEEGGEEEEAVSTITLSWPGHEADKDGVFPAVDIVAGMSVELTVGAEAGIAGFVIRLESDTPAFMSLCSMMTSTVLTADQAAAQGYVMIDLIGDPEAVTKMAGVGLSTGDQLKNKTSVPFSLSTLVPMIPSAGQAGSDTNHTFILTVTDNNGDENSWSLTFHVPAE